MALGHWLKDYIGPKDSGGASIPIPTVEDAGKSIVVNDEGQYELSANSGGGTLVVSVDHFDEESGKTYFDRTWQEVYDAIAQGKVVTVPSVDDEEGRAQFFTVVLASSTGNYAVSVSDESALNADSADGYLYILREG